MKYIYIILCILITLCSFAEAKETEDELTDREKMMMEARQKAKEKEKARKAAKKEGRKYKPGSICYIGEDVTYAFYNQKLARRYSLAQERALSGSAAKTYGKAKDDDDEEDEKATCEEILAMAGDQIVQCKRGHKVKIKAIKGGDIAVIQRGKKDLFLPVSDLMTQSEYKAFSVREGAGWINGLPDEWALLDKGDFFKVKGKLYGFKSLSDAETYGKILAKNPFKAQKYVDFHLKKESAVLYAKGVELLVENDYNSSYTELPDMAKRCVRCSKSGGYGESMYVSVCEYAINEQLSIPASELKKRAELRKNDKTEPLPVREGEGWTNGLPDNWILLNQGDFITVKGKTYAFKYMGDAETYGSLLAKDYEKAQKYANLQVRKKNAIIYTQGVELVVENVYNTHHKELPDKAKRIAKCAVLSGEDDSLYISECEYAINQQLHK